MKRCAGYRNFLEIKQFVCLTYGFRKRAMMNNEQNIEQAALAILRSTGISILDAAMLAKTALEAGGARRKPFCLRRGSRFRNYSDQGIEARVSTH